MTTLPGPNATPATYETVVYVLGQLAGTITMVDVDAVAALVDAGTVPATAEERRMLHGAQDFRRAVLDVGPTAYAELRRLTAWVLEHAPEEIADGDACVVDVVLRMLEQAKKQPTRRPAKKVPPEKAAS